MLLLCQNLSGIYIDNQGHNQFPFFLVNFKLQYLSLRTTEIPAYFYSPLATASRSVLTFYTAYAQLETGECVERHCMQNLGLIFL